MYAGSLFVLALAIFGASAQFVSTGCGVGLNTFDAGYGVGLNTLNTLGAGTTIGSAPLIENVPIRLPGLVSPTTVQDSCNCVKTIVRPQIRKEIFTIPSVQRFVQTSTTPVVETIPYLRASSVDVPAVGVAGLGVPAIGGVVSGVNSGYGLVSGVSTGLGGIVGSGLGTAC